MKKSSSRNIFQAMRFISFRRFFSKLKSLHKNKEWRNIAIPYKGSLGSK